MAAKMAWVDPCASTASLYPHHAGGGMVLDSLQAGNGKSVEDRGGVVKHHGRTTRLIHWRLSVKK